MAEFPNLPLWTDALLGDTQHLTQAEFGAYLLMLITAWRTRDCALPNDPRFLAKVSRSERNWTKISHAVLPFWTLGEDGQLRQKRLSQVRLALTNLSEQKRAAGRASALKRLNTASTSVERVLPPRSNGRSTNQNQNQNQKESIPSVCVPDGTPKPERLPFQEALKSYNEAAAKAGWPIAKKVANGRRVNLSARLREHGIEVWSESMTRASRSDFLTGKAHRGAGHESWTPDLGFFAKAENFTKLIEGRYDNRHAAQSQPFISKEQRAELERIEAENLKKMGLL